MAKTTQVTRTTIDAARAVSKTQESQLRRVPSPVRFLLVVFNSLLLSSVLFTMTSSVTLGELGRVSKHLEAWWEVGGLMLWKAVEVGLAWVLGFDGELYPTSLAMFSVLMVLFQGVTSCRSLFLLICRPTLYCGHSTASDRPPSWPHMALL